ncbi:NHL repeat containing protein [Pedosphaera parvula]|uniref:NHL repeat containing protein n=1 Tax=Pedosphaera parvula (strain Ellin514) TaxID=320771 RepID=B9XPT1_PEDPL|nr:NHL repeat containing protein [Pedosphaera parvula]EEF58204.1 NHL repeat containing protein [Pedosphaera parvula Ellin514]
MVLNNFKNIGSCCVLAAGLLLSGWGTTVKAQLFTFTTPTTGATGAGNSKDGTNTAAHFYSPQSVACDASGNVYVADYNGRVIRKVEVIGKDWVVTTIAGTNQAYGTKDGTNAEARFTGPTGLAVDASGNVFVAEGYANTIRKLSPIGTNWIVTTIAGLAGSSGSADGTNSDARFYLPYGNMACDTNGNLFVTDGYDTIRQLRPDGTNWVVTTIAGAAGIHGFKDGTNNDALFYSPIGLALDSAGNMYVADTGNNAIRKLTLEGTNWVVTTIAGSTNQQNGSLDGTNNQALFTWPESPAVDSAGNVYVADSYNYTIRKVTVVGTDYVVSTVGGRAGFSYPLDGVSTKAAFVNPVSVALDKNGNLYVADHSYNTVRCGWVESMASPTLQISSLPNKAVLKWEPWAPRYVVETNSSLLPGSAWGVLTNAPGILGNQFAVTNSVNGAPVFYRLHAP